MSFISPKSILFAFPTILAIAMAGFATTASEALHPGPVPEGQGIELWVSGTNETDQVLDVWIRVDGPNSYDFSSRTNLYRAVQAGEFLLRLNVADLTTARGERLNLGPDPTVRIFAHEGRAELSDVQVFWRKPIEAPTGIIALDFGDPDGPVFPGFKAAGAEAEFVVGARLSNLTRPGVDALARDGVSGVELIELKPEPGRYLVKLWLEDLGAWEFVPHALRQRVRINGNNLIDRTDTPEEWVEQRWALGSRNRWQPDGDAWENFGERRSGVLSLPIDVGEEGLRIEFAGDRAGALFVAALVVVPEDRAEWLDLVQLEQSDRFRAAWPVDVSLAKEELEGYRRAPSSLTLVPGQTGWLRFDGGKSGSLELVQPVMAGASVPAKLMIGQRYLARPSPLNPALAPFARTLVSAASAAGTDPIGRPLVVEVSVPEGAETGVYRGAIDTVDRAIPFEVIVMPIDLPVAPVPVGVYLADPPHHRWLKTDPRPDRICRYRTLASMGLTGVSPPLETPIAERLDVFRHDAALVREHFGSQPHLSYQELQRLFEALGPEAALEALPAAVDAAPGMIWSAADEPSNPGLHGRSLADHVADIRAAAPAIKLAAHLNDPADEQLVQLFDVALVNPGFGIDLADFDQLAKSDIEAWIYNTGPERLAAGFYGWRVGSKGYLMWHGMMPTADPFDPTDGREGDAILLPPVGEACADTVAIDERLIRIAEGAADRRWLAWLDEAAEVHPEAFRFRGSLLAKIPPNWDDAKLVLDGSALDELRAEIADFVSKTKGF